MDNIDTGILLIGLGGTGGEVLRIIKKRMQNSPYRDYVAYYYLDSRARAQEGFNPGEYRHIGGFRVSSKVKQHKQYIRDWWYHDKYSPDFDTRDGAGQTRLIGRLCYYLNADDIRKEIDNIITNKLLGEKLDVIVVSSSGGGTGSGLFVDIGYLLRHLIGERKSTFYVGVLLDPTVVRDRIAPDRCAQNQTEINGIAFLTELEFYMGRNGGYNFNIFSEGRVQSISENQLKPFDLVCLIQVENRKGYHFSHKEDYYSLQAEGIWHLINISFRFLAEKGSGLENYFKELAEASLCDGKTQFYSSFGCASIYFPFDKVYSYCLDKYCDLILSKLLEDVSTDDIKSINDEVIKFILDNNIKESDNSDQLIRYCRKAFYEGTNRRWHFTDIELFNFINNRLDKSGKNFQNLLNDLEKTLSNDLTSFEARLKNLLKEKSNEVWQNIEAKVNNFLKEAKWKLAYNFLSELSNAVEYELNDLIQTEEEGWLKKRTSQSISQTINQLINQINDNYNPPFIRKIFKAAQLKSEITYLKNQLAKKWSEEYFNFNFYDHILKHLKLFYLNIIEKINNRRENLNKTIQEIEDFRKGLRIKGVLNSRADVAGHKIGVDFVFEICSSEETVDKMIFSRFDKTCLIEDIRRIARIPNTGELKKVVKETTEKLLFDLSLDQAFILESKYFWSERKPNLKDTFLSGLQPQKEELIDELKYIFGIDTLRSLREKVENRHERYNEDEIINELIKGRIECLLDWAKPFWQWRQGVPGISSPFTFSIYHIHEGNKIVSAILERLNASIAAKPYIKTTAFDFDDKYSLLFFQLEGKQPLFNLLPIYNLKNAEQRRRQVISSFKSGKYTPNPDEIGYSDKKFIFEPPYCHFSIIPLESEEKAFLVFGLSELLGFIKPIISNKRQNFQLSNDLALKAGLSDTIMGRSLKDALDYLNRHPDLLTHLEKTCLQVINKRLITDRQDFIYCVKNQLSQYARLKSKYCSKGKQDTPLCQLYKTLFNSLQKYAHENNLIE